MFATVGDLSVAIRFLSIYRKLGTMMHGRRLSVNYDLLVVDDWEIIGNSGEWQSTHM